jgi:hypothetical protein
MEMYGPDSKTGKEFKTMEIKFTKNKNINLKKIRRKICDFLSFVFLLGSF